MKLFRAIGAALALSLGMVGGLTIREGHVAFSLEVERERGPRLEPLRKAAEAAVDALQGVLSASAVLTAEAQRPAALAVSASWLAGQPVASMTCQPKSA